MSRSIWRFAAPAERTTYNANALLEGVPLSVRQGVEETGTVIDPRATAALYSDAQRAFGPADVTVSEVIAYGPVDGQVLQVIYRRMLDGQTASSCLADGPPFFGHLYFQAS